MLHLLLLCELQSRIGTPDRRKADSARASFSAASIHEPEREIARLVLLLQLLRRSMRSAPATDAGKKRAVIALNRELDFYFRLCIIQMQL